MIHARSLVSWSSALVRGGMQKYHLGSMEVSYRSTGHTGLDFADLAIVSRNGKFRR